jgi:twitching motility two-component system response regulator PilH
VVVKKVLVVDDSAADRTNLKGILAGNGYQVVMASTGAESLQQAKTEKPDLIFMDIIMPDMDGYEACRLLHNDADTKGIPVVFVTSKNQKADRVWAQMQGGKAFITKPYTPDQILEQLSALA